jgi:ribosomal protein S20
MPILANAKKALRVSKKKTIANRRTKSLVKTFVDKVLKNPTAESLSAAFSQVDKAVKKNVLHRNKAARIKSRMSKLASGSTAAPAVAKAKVAKAAKPAAAKAKAKPAAKKTAAKKTK